MNIIAVKQVLPHFISDMAVTVSDIWGKDVSFQKGSNSLITARSGAGKSSLLSFMFGERSDYRGSILYDGQAISSLRHLEWVNVRQHSISFVFQGLRLFPALTVLENIQLKNKLTQHKSETEIIDLLNQCELGDKLNDKAAYLSFGQQQRVAVIRALCQPFDFLLMDEPFSHLDRQCIDKMTDIVQQELFRQQAGLILTSLGPTYQFDYQQHMKL